MEYGLEVCLSIPGITITESDHWGGSNEYENQNDSSFFDWL